MQFSGDAKAWEGVLQFIPDILELICDVWSNMRGVASTDNEVGITERFLMPLRRNKRDLPFRIYPEISVPDKATGHPLGRVDIEFVPCGSADEDVYFAIECKRLRIPEHGKVRSNADQYVGAEGIMRFVCGKYSKGHPAGAMAGYVMDGDCPLAIASIREAIKKKSADLRIAADSGLGPCTCLQNRDNVKESRHTAAGGSFLIYHVFLAVGRSQAAQSETASLN